MSSLFQNVKSSFQPQSTLPLMQIFLNLKVKICNFNFLMCSTKAKYESWEEGVIRTIPVRIRQDQELLQFNLNISRQSQNRREHFSGLKFFFWLVSYWKTKNAEIESKLRCTSLESHIPFVWKKKKSQGLQFTYTYIYI